MIESFLDAAPEGYEVQNIFFNDQNVVDHFVETENSLKRPVVIQYTKWKNGRETHHRHHLHIQIRRKK